MPIYSKDGKLPKGLSKKEMKNTVVTARGIERVVTYTDSDGTARRKSMLYNGLRGGLAGAGAARPSSVQFTKSAVSANTPVDVHVSFNQKIESTGSPTISVSNTTANTSVSATSNSSVTHAENTLTFTFTPTTAGTYTVLPQTLGAATVTYTDVDGVEGTANTAIASDVIFGNLIVS